MPSGVAGVLEARSAADESQRCRLLQCGPEARRASGTGGERDAITAALRRACMALARNGREQNKAAVTDLFVLFSGSLLRWRERHPTGQSSQ